MAHLYFEGEGGDEILAYIVLGKVHNSAQGQLIAKKVSKKIANMANLITIFTFELFTQITSNFVSIHNMSFQGVGVLKRTCLTFSRSIFFLSGGGGQISQIIDKAWKH